MRILLIGSSYNSLTQRVHVELQWHKHDVSVCLSVSDEEMLSAVSTFKPELIICPMLKKRVPEDIWRHITTLIVHPGIVGDRGPSSLDWAIQQQEPEWGVTVLQADHEMDAGPVWATRNFRVRAASKSALYREEVSTLALQAVMEAVDKFARGVAPIPLDYAQPEVRGCWRDAMKLSARKVDFVTDSTDQILRKIRAADGDPGVPDTLFGQPFLLFGAHPESALRGKPGEVLAKRQGAICRATRDGAVWLSHLRKVLPERSASFKLPATMALGALARTIPEHAGSDRLGVGDQTYKEIWYEEADGVGYLYFEFYNGAMSTDQCDRLRRAFIAAKQRPTRAIVLAGGRLYWSNGIHLNVIEASDDPGAESWRNLDAMNDLVLEILTAESHWVVSAVHGSAGAGGVILALAADEVLVREGVILNPHYRSMGGLHGAEYWTYLLPRRVGAAMATRLTESCLPVMDREALQMGLVDGVLAPTADAGFSQRIERHVRDTIAREDFATQMARKRKRRRQDEQTKPLAAYRAYEMEQVVQSFNDPDSDYHLARAQFVRKQPSTHTPERLVHPLARRSVRSVA